MKRHSRPNLRPQKRPQMQWWCDACKRSTVHQVIEGRRGACYVCLAAEEEAARERKRGHLGEELFR